MKNITKKKESLLFVLIVKITSWIVSPGLDCHVSHTPTRAHLRFTYSASNDSVHLKDIRN